MSDKAGRSEGSSLDGDGAGHGNALVEGVGTAISWLTVIPLRGARVFDRVTGRRAIAALPVAGLVPGLAAVFLAWFAATLPPLADGGGPAPGPSPAITVNPLLPFLVGVLVVVLSESLTRGMHLDGLADVADALGSYRGPVDARKVLADPATGPMGVGAVTLTLLTQAAAFGVLATDAFYADGGSAGIFRDGLFPPPWGAILVFALPFLFARAAAMSACHRSFPRMSDSGFGSLTAGTQSGWSVTLWWVVLTAFGGAVAGLSGVIAAFTAGAFAWAFTRRVVKRLGGVNGDALGAIVQVATAVTAVILAVG